MHLKEKLFVLGIATLVIVLGSIAAQQAFGLEAQGRGTNKQKAVENSHISAHFQCGRKGLWADLDALKITKVDRQSYKLAGGTKVITDYIVTAEFPCKAEYQRYPSVVQ